ncbi:MAG: cyclic-di-AMP receptor [Capsulimonadaceae bacterium]|nr:cyclic-di-AMP receptor [Capsulimonadaceae bacterium]
MKLIIGITQARDKRRLFDELVEAGIKFTTLGSTGGFLRRASTTLLIGAQDEEVERILRIFREQCSSHEDFVNIPSEYAPLAGLSATISQAVKVKTGGAITLVLDVERMETY